MLKENTRKAISIEISMSLYGNGAVRTVKAAREIFHTEWNDTDISLFCEHIKKYGAADWSSESWKNDTEQIYKQLILFSLKATDFQLALWLEKAWKDGEKALKFLCSCEQEF